jgi:hypothetical protein
MTATETIQEKKEWHSMTEDERIKEIYSRYTIQDFWNFWSSKDSRYMEIRIKDFKLLRQIARYLDIPFSISGVYVCNAMQLRNVISLARDRCKLWFGVNPRKRNHLDDGSINFGGKDYFVENIQFLFVDIDRVFKEGLATPKELENCSIVADKIIERFSKEGWDKAYAKICSGNGVQLLLKLDVPIRMPSVEFDMAKKEYVENDDFERIKAIVRNGMGNQIIKYARRFKDKYGCEVDSGALKLMQVAALPFTKNFKYDSFRWRGIVDLKDGVNDGLSDYVISLKNENIEFFKKRNVFSSTNVKAENFVSPGHLIEHPLVRLLLDYDLPHGAINNKIWFSLKLLLRDCHFNLKSDEFKGFHRELEKKYKDNFSLNIPERKYVFNERVVNNYCLENNIPLVYDYWSFRDKVKKLDMGIEDLNFDYRLMTDNYYQLGSDTNILQDLFVCKKKLVERSNGNKFIISRFINGCIKKYGEEKTRYYCDAIFYKFLSFD